MANGTVMENVKKLCDSVGIPCAIGTTTTGKGQDTKEVSFWSPVFTKMSPSSDNWERILLYIGEVNGFQDAADIQGEVYDLLERRVRLDLMNSARGGLRDPVKSQSKARGELSKLFTALAGEDASFFAKAREIALRQGVDLDELMAVAKK